MIDIAAEMPDGTMTHFRFLGWVGAAQLALTAATIEGILARDPDVPVMGDGEILLEAADVIAEARQAERAEQAKSAAAQSASAAGPSRRARAWVRQNWGV